MVTLRARRGMGSIGCLLMLLLVAASGYFGLKVGEVYWRFYSYEDAMKQQARFAGQNTDAQIVARLVARADSLGLPGEAQDVTVERTGRRIVISATYTELVELPLHVRKFSFSPRAEHDY